VGDAACGSEGLRGVAELPLFPPGPSDAEGWQRLLADYPWLAPAVESGVRVSLDGVAVVVDANRADQLRAIGNGCVSVQVAAAFIELSRRAGIDWGGEMNNWATPNVDDVSNLTRDSGVFKSLTRDVAQWSTPQAFDANDCQRQTPTNRGGTRTLANDLKGWSL
jgi:hypothetical protein